MFGIVTACEPSLAVVAARTVGKVWPPSVDSEIFTLGARVALSVLLTFQVTVCELLPAYDTAVAWLVARSGPASLSTVSTVSPNCVPPPVATRSRAVSRNVIDVGV